MKVALSVLLVVLVGAVCTSGLSLSESSRSRSKRGFRTGAADRFSHGFGKRGQENLIDEEGDEAVMTTAEMADMLRERPLLINSFVRKYIDMNGDGVVSRDELFGEMKKRR